jgi:hypothetical protein
LNHAPTSWGKGGSSGCFSLKRRHGLSMPE